MRRRVRMSVSIKFFQPLLHWFNSSRVDLLALASFAILLVFVARELVGTPVMAAGDLSAYPESIDQFLTFISSSWLPLVHGGGLAVIDSVMVVRLFFFLVAFGNPALAQLFFQFFPYFLAFAGMYYFLPILRVGRVARYVTALLYATNAFAVISFIAVGWVYGMALLPILTLLLFRLTSDKALRMKIGDILLFAGVLALSLKFTQSLAIFMIPIILFSILRAIYSSGFRKGFASLFAVAIAMSITLWFYGLSFFSLAAYHPSYLVPGGMLDVASLGVHYSYSGSVSPAVNIFTAQPLGVFEWGTNPWMLALGMLLPLLAFSGLVLRKTDGTKLFFAVMSLVVVLFIHSTWLGLTMDLFRTFRFLVLLPNEGLPSMYLIFLYMPLLSIFMDSLVGIRKRARIRRGVRTRKRVTRLLSLALLVGLMMVPSWPLFTGHMGLLDLRRGYYTYGLFIPHKYYEIHDWFDRAPSHDRFARILWLPNNYGDVQLKAKYLFNLLDFPYGADRLSIPKMVLYEREVLRYVFEQGNSKHMGTLLAPLNVRYIVLDTESNEKGQPKVGEGFVRGDPRLLIRTLAEQDEFELVANTPKYMIYENTKHIPNLYAFGSIALIDSQQGEYEQVVRLMDLLASTPGFDVRNTMALFSHLIDAQQRQFLTERATMIVSEDISGRSSRISTGKELLFFYPSVSKLVGGLGSEKDVEVDEDGMYKLILLDPGMRLEAVVNGAGVNFTKLGDQWYQSEDFKLKRGVNKVEIQTPVLGHTGGILRSLLGYWTFDEGLGDVVNDASGNANDAHISKPDWISSRFGSTLKFDENFAVVKPAKSYDLINGMTIQAWIEPEIGSSAKTIIFMPLDEQSQFGFLFRVNNEDLELQIFDGTRIIEHIASGIVVGRPQHVAFSLNGNTMSLFHNGEQVVEKGWKKSLGPSNITLVIGMREKGFPQFYKGSIYEVKFHAEALNASAIKAEYDGSRPFYSPEMQATLGSQTLIGQIFPAAQEAPLLGISVTQRPSLDVQSMTNTERRFKVDSGSPSWVYLGEPFHRGWNAYPDEGDELIHMPGFMGGNAYYVNSSGTASVTVYYEGQRTRDLLNFLWLSSWVALIMGIVLCRALPLHKRKALPHISRWSL